MFDPQLKQSADEIGYLHALVVTTVPDGLLFDTWKSQELSWDIQDLVNHLGRLYQSHAQVSQGSGAGEVQHFIIESGQAVIFLVPLNEHFLSSFLFAPRTPLGIGRFCVGELAQQIRTLLPPLDSIQPSRAGKILVHLKRVGPDPHALRLRLALQTGLPVSAFESPEQMTEEQVKRLEVAACEILGVDHLQL